MIDFGPMQPYTERPWSSFIPDRDREVYVASGFGFPKGLGDRPALLIVDVTYAFCGAHPEPILESIAQWRLSCGSNAWSAIEVVKRLLKAAHIADIPVFYSRGSNDPGRRRVPAELPESTDHEGINRIEGNEIVSEIAPRSGDHVIVKSKPSIFFNTGLAQRLADLDIDSVIVCGCTTSGCVRASVVDAFSHGLRVGVVSGATFDRSEFSHATSLFDIQMKYGSVLSEDNVRDYLCRVSRRDKRSNG